MTFLQSLILGIVQGLTEFLPVSSSAHLVLIPYLFDWKIPESQVFPFDVLVQVGTLIAVILYFRKDLWAVIKAFVQGLIHRKPFADPDSRMGWYIILASIPAGIAGLLLKSKVEAAFNNPRLTAYFLFITALLLFAAEFFGKKIRALPEMKWKDALWIGAFQALSIFPGISRSGSTITGGMTRNFQRPAAARFSFMMSIPIMAAAGALSISDLKDVPNLGEFLPLIAVGFITAGIVGYLSIHWLLSFLNKGSLNYFAIYCILLASLVLIVGRVRAEQPLTPSQQPSASATKTVQDLNQATSESSLVFLDYTPAMDWMEPVFTICAQVLPEADLITHFASPDLTQPENGHFLLRWGDPGNMQVPAYQVGSTRLSLAVHPENPLANLTPQLVSDVFSAGIQTWSGLYESCPQCFESKPDEKLLSAPIALLLYADNDENSLLFKQLYMTDSPLASSLAVVVPSSSAMRVALAEDPNAIGFLPEKALTSGSGAVTIEEVDPAADSLPILAYTNETPQGASLLWLQCLQAALD